MTILNILSGRRGKDMRYSNRDAILLKPSCTTIWHQHSVAKTSFQNYLQDVSSKPLKRLQSNPCRQMRDNRSVALCDSRGEITPSPLSLLKGKFF